MNKYTIGWLVVLIGNFPMLSRLSAASVTSPAPSSRTAILQSIPADAWVVLAYTPGGGDDSTQAEQVSGSLLDAASALLALVRQMGLLNVADPTTAAWIDVLTSLPLVTRFPFALCLLEGQAKALDSGGYRLDGLSAALIVRTEGNHQAIRARIQQLLNTHVNNQVARIEPFRSGRYTGHRLTDQRLADWCTLQWGAMGQNYVITLGQGTYERLAAVRKPDRPALADDVWFAKASRRCLGKATEVYLSIRFDAISKHLKPVMAGKPHAVLKALDLSDVDRGLWTFAKTGRAVQAVALMTRNNLDETVTICRSADHDAWARKVIPTQATQYAIIEKPPAQIVRLIRDAYLAARSPSSQKRFRDMWTRVQAETDIDLDRDLLDQLGQRLAIHDYPPHPLGIPVARTLVAEITGSPIAVRLAVDRLMRRWQREFQPDTRDDWTLLQLHRADDGVWFFQAGLYGPAAAVTDRWLVVSYSPMAVRQNLALLESSKPDTAASLPNP